MMALFSPINHDGSGVAIRFLGQEHYQALPCPAGDYPTLADLVAALRLAALPGGFTVSLEAVDALAGLEVRLSHAIPFHLRVEAESGLGRVLGFAQGDRPQARVCHCSDTPPPHALRTDATGEPFLMRPAPGFVQASTLTGSTTGGVWGWSRGGRLVLRGLSPLHLERLEALWRRCATDSVALYLATGDWRTESAPHQAMYALRPDWARQSRFSPARSWPAPHPPYGDVELSFVEVP